MAPTPSSSSSSSKPIPPTHTFFKTPQSKHRLNFTSNNARTTPNQPTSTAKETAFPPPIASATQEHPIEVICRIRDYPDKKEKPVSILQENNENNTLRVRSEIGYRDFTLDGISFSEVEDIDDFYKRFVKGRIDGVKLGDKCTIMMYGPTGSGKSHTMFGCPKQPGMVYRALRDILGGEGGEGEEGADKGERIAGCTFVQVSILEIYNEEIYDLLSSNGGGLGFGWPKGGSASKVKLEVMGKKAKNASFLSGTEAGKISKEIQKVEKRRIVKSTLCNDRSSRSHCMIILDVPTVGGRLMLVDMAGSENIEQAGQNGFEAKMQTAKINQGNIALKRVVESIANGESHVPFRDSKLTMLLQDSFEDDKSKILMILCASPDPKEMHKTICTLEYGAKAKCIVRGPHTPIKDKVGADNSSAVILVSRIAAMDQFIYKLQTENKLREKERNEAHKQLMKKEEEVAALRALIKEKGSAPSQEEINIKVNERTKMLECELEKKLEECQRMAEEFVAMERRRMEERIVQQQQEVEMLRRRLEEIESQLCRGGSMHENDSMGELEGSNFARRLMGVYADEDPGMVKSMDLDMDDVRHVDMVGFHQSDSSMVISPQLSNQVDSFAQRYGDKVPLSTVFEEEETEEEEHKDKAEDEEVEKEVIEVRMVNGSSPRINVNAGSLAFCPQKPEMCTLVTTNLSDDSHLVDGSEGKHMILTPLNELQNLKDSASSRQVRIQNIFTLCGNHRELSQNLRTPVTKNKGFEDAASQTFPVAAAVPADSSNKENLPLTPTVGFMTHEDEGLSPKLPQHPNSTPLITVRRN